MQLTKRNPYEKKVIRKIKNMLRHLRYIEESWDASGRDRATAKHIAYELESTFVRWYMVRGFYKTKKRGGEK
jgi:hypothetical protein